MSIDLVARLESVRESAAPDQWIARCPAHEDKSPSLSVRRADDGRWLVHCFAGCSAGEICSALGIGLADLYSRSEAQRHRRRHALTASERLELIDHEVTVVTLVVADLLERRAVDESMWERLAQACHRIGRARYAQ